MEKASRLSPERIEELEQAALDGKIPEGTGSFRQMQENAERKLAQQADQARHKLAIEHRIVSGDVQQLNDQAMIEIYGTEVPAQRGKGKNTENFTVSIRVVDPASGEKIEPKGLLAQMREEPLSMNGRPQAERDAETAKREKRAKKYEKDLLSLVEKEGFELVQAKLIMDLRAKDEVEKAKFIEKLKSEGRTLHDKDGNPITPAQKAAERYNHLDEERRKLIKAEGVFTLDEYKRARKGEDLYAAPQLTEEALHDEAAEEEVAEPDQETAEVDEEEAENGPVDEEKTEPETRDEFISAIDDLLDELEEKGNPGTRSADLLIPVKKSRIPLIGRVRNRQKEVGLRKHSELLNVRASGGSGFNNLTKSTLGHDVAGEATGWTMPSRKGAPEPSYYYPRESGAKFVPWSEHMFITPDGEVYRAFIRASVDPESEDYDKLLVDEAYKLEFEELPLDQLKTIRQYLQYHLRDEEPGGEEPQDEEQATNDMDEFRDTDPEEQEEILGKARDDATKTRELSVSARAEAEEEQAKLREKREALAEAEARLGLAENELDEAENDEDEEENV